MAAFPTSVATDSDLYIAVNSTSTQLTDNPLSNVATTVNVVDTTAFPSVGFISIDTEIIKYTGKTATSFTGCTRGADGTTAASHVQNSFVFHNVIAAHHNALKDDLIATQQFISDLIGRSTTQIKAPNGTASAPSNSFASDTSLGLYRSSVDVLGFASGGGNVGLLGVFGGTAQFQGRDGSLAAPYWSFVNDPDSGIYLTSAGNVSIGVNGSELMRWSQTNALVSILGARDLSIPSGRFLYLDGGSNTYIAEGAADRITMVTGGTTRVNLDNSGFFSIIGLDLYIGPTKKFFLDGGGDTYIIESSANQIDFYTGGLQRFAIAASGLITSLGKHEFADGSAAAPSIGFTNDPDTGFYLRLANSTGVACGGVLVFDFNPTVQRVITGNFAIISSGGVLQNNDGSAAAPSYTFGADTDTGIYRSTTNTLVISAGGGGVAVFAPTGVTLQGTTTNDNAATGNIGEYISSAVTSNTNFPATTAFGDATSISLTAGDWDVDCEYYFDRNTATWTTVTWGLSSTAGNDSTGLTRPTTANSGAWASSATTPQEVPAHLTVRFSLSATTTIYAKVSATYSAGQPQYRASLTARRIR